MFKSFSKLVASDTGRIVISIILGIGLATLFKKACNDRNCLVFKSPAIADVKDKVFQHGSQCVTFNEKSIECNTKKQQIEFE
jgi:hypothetical protein